MKSIFVINENNECLGNIDFLPRQEEKIIVNDIAFEVEDVIYNQKENAVIVYCCKALGKYNKKTKCIKW